MLTVDTYVTIATLLRLYTILCRQFQHRQLCDTAGAAQPVSTHAELVTYLQQRSAGGREYLPFEGMNQVVFKGV